MAKDKKELVPCWKCLNRIETHIKPGVTEFVGCRKNNRIKKYEDAKKHCPISPD